MTTRDRQRAVASAQQVSGMSASFASLLERMVLAEDACTAVHAENDRLLVKPADPLSLSQARLAEKRAEQDLSAVVKEIVETPAVYVGDALAKLHVWKMATCGSDTDMAALSPMEQIAVSAISDLDQLLG